MTSPAHFIFVVATIVIVTAAVAIAKQAPPALATVTAIIGVFVAVFIYRPLTRRQRR